jgi:hypothetical protein
MLVIREVGSKSQENYGLNSAVMVVVTVAVAVVVVVAVVVSEHI